MPGTPPIPWPSTATSHRLQACSSSQGKVAAGEASASRGSSSSLSEGVEGPGRSRWRAVGRGQARSTARAGST